MSKEVEASVPFAALSKATKRVYQIICTEVARSGTGSAPITAAALMAAINSNSTAAIAAATRELRGLGFVTTTKGIRCATVFALSTDWQAITDPATAKAMAAEARVSQKRGPLSRAYSRAKVKPVEPVEVEEEPQEPPRVGITLPVLSWPSERGMALLAENP